MEKRVMTGVGMLAFTATLAAIIAYLLQSQGISPEVPIITTEVTTPTAGRITGRTVEGVREFLNIKYAQDPVGQLRFQPPVPLTRATGEEVDATDDTPVVCVQSAVNTMDPNGPPGVEECLVLSVRAPERSDKEEKLPIVVWIHGGGLMIGYGEGKSYHFDGDTTKKMGVVSVNINYRLGFLGWAALAGISPNNGLQDMITALKWVRDNGAAFGGDPDNVTVVGESGGATAILALLRSPLAAGLFTRAIVLSPAPEWESEENIKTIQETVWLPQTGCKPDDAELLECLVSVDASTYSLTVDDENPLPGFGYFEFPLRYGADKKVAEAIGLVFQDGKVVTSSTFISSAKVILSNLVDEVAFLPSNLQIAASWEKAAPLITSLLPGVANISITAESLVMGPYRDLEPVKIWDRLVTDIRSTCPTNVLAVDNSGVADVTRVLITHHLITEGLTRQSYPAMHSYDTFALFGFDTTGMWGYLPNPSEAERRFQDAMIELVMRETGVSGGHVVLARAEDGGAERREEVGMPRDGVCKWLAENGITGYGWTN